LTLVSDRLRQINRVRTGIMGRPKATKPKEAPAAKEAAERLDEYLPIFEPTETEVHLNAAVLEVGDPLQLLELAADTALRPFLLCRLSERVALVDPGRAGDLAEALKKRGHTPKLHKS
jgi:hypothetical protein